MTAAHGGFGSEQVPLGGGAAVFERLCQSWSGVEGVELLAVGAGPRGPQDTAYRQVAAPTRPPSALSTFAYARFCSDFERASTELALAEKPNIVLAHDISEGPNISALRAAGIAVATVFHVDVVDIFSRLYLGSVVKPQTLVNMFARTESLPWPSVLKLVFQKQKEVMERGQLNLVPSPGAAELLGVCYPGAPSVTEVVGWGAPELNLSEDAIAQRARELRTEYEIPQYHRVVLTLSRLSPEKAQHRLLQAVALAESEGRAPKDVTLVVAGAPAFMQGDRHAKRLRRLAAKLRTRVVFPGHVGGLDKAGWYRTADLFAVCSLHESYGLTTLEAMQQGCPVVAVSSFGTRATVAPLAGRLVPPGPELVRRLWGELELLITDGSEGIRSSLSEGAKQTAREQSFQSASGRVLEALKRLEPMRKSHRNH